MQDASVRILNVEELVTKCIKEEIKYTSFNIYFYVQKVIKNKLCEYTVFTVHT